jgi:hypothetical protein
MSYTNKTNDFAVTGNSNSFWDDIVDEQLSLRFCHSEELTVAFP